METGMETGLLVFGGWNSVFCYLMGMGKLDIKLMETRL
jgi:hypothetical protein